MNDQQKKTRNFRIGFGLVVLAAVIGGGIAASNESDFRASTSFINNVSGYCRSLKEQHRQHRNASFAMGRELDAMSARHGVSSSYSADTAAISDAMYQSLLSDNGCN